jgi:hypothetical protein
LQGFAARLERIRLADSSSALDDHDAGGRAADGIDHRPLIAGQRRPRCNGRRDVRIARHTDVGVCPLLGGAGHPLLEEEHLRRGVPEVAAGLDPPRDRVALSLAVLRAGEQRHRRVTVGQHVVGRLLDASPAHAQGCMRGDVADQVTADEGCRLGGESVDTEDLDGIAHVELAREQSIGFAVHQIVHPGAVESNATRPLSPLCEEILGGSDLVVCSPGCRAWPPPGRWRTRWPRLCAA